MEESSEAISNKYLEIAKELGIEVIEDLSSYFIPEKLTQRIPFSIARKHHVLVLEEHEDHVLVAVLDPINLKAVDEVRWRFENKHVQTVVSPAKVLEEAIQIAYQSSEAESDEKREEEVSEEDIDIYDLLEIRDEAPVVKLLNKILREAIKEGVSDIHFEPFGSELTVRFRIDGILQKKEFKISDLSQSLVTRVKVLAQMDIAERRLPQDGRIKLKFGGREIDFRVSSVPVVHGERLVLRVLDKGNVVLGIDQIGMPEETKRVFRQLIQMNEGILLVTGPTGSGKTTTLYSAISELSLDTENIMTVEDPVEYKLENIAQIAVHPKIGLTFAKGLRHILRQDPDIIMIGEIRDKETAQIAIQASLTGHMVLSTLHTNDAPSAVTRLVDMGIEPYLLSSSLIGVIAQRLVRAICPSCKEAYTSSQSEERDLGVNENVTLYRGKGCKDCFYTGYKGRHGIYELMPITQRLRSAISRDINADSLRDQALESGMRTLKESAYQLVLDGKTTLEEAIRVTRSLEEE